MKTIKLAVAAISLLSASAAFGADLTVPAPMPPPVARFSWTSCYVGGSAGGGIGRKDITDTAGLLSPTTGFTSETLDISGYQLGGQVGCNYQFAPNWVAGIEGAAAGGYIGTKNSFATPGIPGDTATFKETTDLLASITARAGYAWDRWLVYGKGGVAFVNDRYNVADFFGTYDFDGVETRLGWTAGVGIEWAFLQDWSVRLEYDYYGFGTRNVNFIDTTISLVSGPEQIKQSVQTLMLGMNFHVSEW
jgi:outer membrane immunogenic protein